MKPSLGSVSLSEAVTSQVVLKDLTQLVFVSGAGAGQCWSGRAHRRATSGKAGGPGLFSCCMHGVWGHSVGAAGELRAASRSWLYGLITSSPEVGTMNIFVFWTYEDGGRPPMTSPRPGGSGPGAEILRLPGLGAWLSGVAPKRMGWCEVTAPSPSALAQRWN